MTIEQTTISLRGLRLHGYHGVAEQERRVGASYELNLCLIIDTPAACESDELSHTINYADVYECVKREFSIPSKLIEHVGRRVAEKLIDTFDLIQSAEVEVVKLHPPIEGFDGSAAFKIFLRK